MSNDYFLFKQFKILQDKCAMKVGTDSVTLGAWVKYESPKEILDIGTGTGIIALMMAQQYPSSHITAIEIDPLATEQAIENVKGTAWNSRIDILNISFQNFASNSNKKFDIIVTNPPYFIDSLKNPDSRKKIARHTDSLTYHELINNSSKLLSEKGELFMIIPSTSLSIIEEEALYAGLNKSKLCSLQASSGKQVKRYLVSFNKNRKEQVIESNLCIDSKEYKNLTNDFYIK